MDLVLRILTWDAATVVGSFGFFFWTFSVYVVTASICMEVRGQLYESVLSFQREIRGSKSGSRACIVTAFSLCTISLLLQTP